MPVRTGLAWAPLGGGTTGLDPLLSSSSLWGATGFSATLDLGPPPALPPPPTSGTPPSSGTGGASGSKGAEGGAGASGSASASGTGGAGGGSGTGGSGGGANGQDLWSTWRSLGLTKLLKKAYNQQQRRGGSAASQAQLAQTQQTVQAALAQMQQALARSQEVLQQQLLLQLQVPPLPGEGGAAAALPGSVDPFLLEAGPSMAPGTAADGAPGSSVAGALVPVSGSLAGGAGGAGSSAAASSLLGGVDGSGLALAAAAAAISRPAADTSNMDCLARRTDQLAFGAGEQDRSRLIKVGWRLPAALWLCRTTLGVPRADGAGGCGAGQGVGWLSCGIDSNHC